MKINKLRSVFSLLLCGIALVFSQSAAVWAVTPSATPSKTNSADTLKVSPLRTDLTIQPGESAQVKTFITNITGATIVVKPIENDFVAGDEKGTPAIILDENSYAPTHSLKRFMIPLQNITVAPGVTQEVDVTIKVPATAQAGGYFGAIRFAPATDGTGQNVNLNASVASLILMTVPGIVTENMTLTNFDVQHNGTTSGNFRSPKDLSLLLRFQNKGSIQEAPFGQIYVQKGKKVVYTYNFNQKDPKNEILPDSARRWTIPLKNLGSFGQYTIGGTFTYGLTGKSIEISKTIWIIPTSYIFGAIGALVLLVLIIVGIRFFLKSYKRKVLRSSRRRY